MGDREFDIFGAPRAEPVSPPRANFVAIAVETARRSSRRARLGFASMDARSHTGAASRYWPPRPGTAWLLTILVATGLLCASAVARGEEADTATPSIAPPPATTLKADAPSPSDSASPHAPDTVRPRQLWEAVLPAHKQETAPHDPRRVRVDAYITQPDGAVRHVPGFYHRDFERARVASVETLTPTGPPTWRVRYRPDAPGAYRVRIDYADRVEGKVLYEGGFTVAGEPLGEGFLRVDPKRPRRFVFQSGKGYFAIGFNLGWVKKGRGTYGFDHYLTRMERAGINYARVWLCTWSLNLRTSKPYVLDHAEAWRLEYLLAEAERRGVRILLCLDNFYDMQHHWTESPFARANGGPCVDRLDYFTAQAAEAQYKAYLRYLVARYSSYTSLLAWEQWNELSYAVEGVAYGTTPEMRENVLVPWSTTMAAVLRGMDPHDHPVTTSLGMNESWPSLWRDMDIGAAQMHTYMRPEVPEERDAADWAQRAQATTLGYGKPGLLSEFGYRGSYIDESKSELNDRDPEGIALHNALWGGSFMGAAGTPMLWWWDNYIDATGQYGHYRALATFLEEVDWAEPIAPMRAEGRAVRVLGLRTATETRLWIQNKQHTWYNRIELERTPATLEGIRLAFRDFAPGTYALSWFDPYKGAYRETVVAEAPAGRMVIKIPPFARDIALRARLQPNRDATGAPSAPDLPGTPDAPGTPDTPAALSAPEPASPQTASTPKARPPTSLEPPKPRKLIQYSRCRQGSNSSGTRGWFDAHASSPRPWGDGR